MNKKITISVVVIALFAVATYWVTNEFGPRQSNKAAASVQSESSKGKHAARVDSSKMISISKYLPKPLNKSNVVEMSFKPTATIFNPAQLAAEAELPAKNGSASAMYWLSLAIKRCKEADMSSDDQIESKVAKRSLGIEAMDRENGKIVDPSRVAQEAANSARDLEQLRDECKKLPANEVDSWQDWLQKSAAAGNGAAREAFAHSVQNQFKDPIYREENYAEFAQQNGLAVQYLNDSVANGDCSNLVLNGFRWVRLQPTQKYVYQSLLLKHGLDYLATDTQSSRNRIDTEVASLNATLKNLAYDVPPDELADAESASNYILQNMCTFD